MNWILMINFISNVVLTISFTAFLIFLFGRENSLIHKLKRINTIGVKIGLSICTAGALYNVLTFSHPPVSEVILNVGLAFVFCWAAWFHYQRFVSPRMIKNKKNSSQRKK
jgi:hypothetical protein